jgi:hypothetical protein
MIALLEQIDIHPCYNGVILEGLDQAKLVILIKILPHELMKNA